MKWPWSRSVEQRDIYSSGARIPDWQTFSGGRSYASVNVTMANAVGLPAVGAAIRLLAETVSQLPLNVYKGVDAEKRLARDSWQYRLLNELPGMGDFTPFDLVSDVVACLETQGNAFLQKVKAAGQVIALIVIDPAKVKVERKDGEKVFTVRDEKGHEQTYSASTILHIRGFTVNGSDVGLSPIALHRQKLGSIIAQDEFQGRFYGQGTHVGSVIKYPNSLTGEQAKELRAQWEAQSSGLANAHLPVVLQGGADFARTSLSLEDSQFVEGARLNLVDVAHIFRIPPSFLDPTAAGTNFEQDNLRFYTLSLAPRLRRIELALFTDADMFPQRVIYPEFDTRPLLRTDALTKAQVEHIQIQDGSKLVDEVRADRGEAPLPDGAGKVPQVTPVGGAPNPKPSLKVANDAVPTAKP